MEETYLLCQDSLEGVLTGVYEAFARRRGHEHTHIVIGEEEQPRLFAEYYPVPVDAGKAVKVIRTINREFGSETYMALCGALATGEADKGEAVYRTVVKGFTLRERRTVMDCLADDYVRRVFELNRFTVNEAHHYKEFIRFRELESGILYSRIEPKCNVVTFVMPHFADRLPLENFIIYDVARGIFGVHPASRQWYTVTGEETEEMGVARYSGREAGYQELFRHFCHKIAIKERTNRKLQIGMLPLRFQEYMVEFEQKP